MISVKDPVLLDIKCPFYYRKNWTFIPIFVFYIFMKVADYIQDKIYRFPKGYIFTYKEFILEVSQKEAAIKALNRMAESGTIRKLSKGRFYKPETTVFGELNPKQGQVVKDLLEKEDKIIGYLTGLSIYNRLGLSSQVGNTIQIGRTEYSPSIVRGTYKISFIRQKNNITKENIPVLQILDAFRFIKKIPDTNITKAYKRLIAIVSNLTEQDLRLMSRLVLSYPANTRALVGAALESLNFNEIEKIKASLNPITKYNLPIDKTVFPNLSNWNI